MEWDGGFFIEKKGVTWEGKEPITKQGHRVPLGGLGRGGGTPSPSLVIPSCFAFWRV